MSHIRGLETEVLGCFQSVTHRSHINLCQKCNTFPYICALPLAQHDLWSYSEPLEICVCSFFYLIKISNAYKKEAESSPWRGIMFLNQDKRPLPMSEAVRNSLVLKALWVPQKKKNAVDRYTSHYLFLHASGVKGNISNCSESFYFSWLYSLYILLYEMYVWGFLWHILLLSCHRTPCNPKQHWTNLNSELNEKLCIRVRWRSV